MSERAADDVRGEPRRAAAGGAAAAAARQQQAPQPQRQPPPRRLRPEDGGPGAASTSAAAAAMATVGERRPLPSPEAMLGQSWNLWVEASKLPGKDGECPRPPRPTPHAPILLPVAPLPQPCDPPPRGQRCYRAVGNAEVPAPTPCVRERASRCRPLTCLSPPPVYLLGTELDESFKEFGKNREVMGLCREGESSPRWGFCRSWGSFLAEFTRVGNFSSPYPLLSAREDAVRRKVEN